MKKSRKESPENKIFVRFFITGLLFSTVVSIILFFSFKEVIRGDFREKAFAVIALFSNSIDGDLHNTIAQQKDRSSSDYVTLENELKKLVSSNDTVLAAYIHLFTRFIVFLITRFFKICEGFF